MKLPGDYKRNYRFRSDTSKEQRYLTIMIAVVIIAAILLYFL
jgi:hypothetical protein